MEHYRKTEGEMERGKDGITEGGKRQRERDSNKIIICLCFKHASFLYGSLFHFQIQPVIFPIKQGDHSTRMASFQPIITEQNHFNTNEGLIIGLMNNNGG